jgi:hypothetical protein
VARQTRRVQVYQAGQWDEDFPGDNWSVPRLIGWLQEKLREIPPEHWDTSRCEIEGTQSYDVAKASITISYERAETDGEMQARAMYEQGLALQTQADERRQYERLKAKFGGDER